MYLPIRPNPLIPIFIAIIPPFLEVLFPGMTFIYFPIIPDT